MACQCHHCSGAALSSQDVPCHAWWVQPGATQFASLSQQSIMWAGLVSVGKSQDVGGDRVESSVVTNPESSLFDSLLSICNRAPPFSSSQLKCKLLKSSSWPCRLHRHWDVLYLHTLTSMLHDKWTEPQLNNYKGNNHSKQNIILGGQQKIPTRPHKM